MEFIRKACKHLAFPSLSSIEGIGGGRFTEQEKKYSEFLHGHLK